MRRRNIIDRLEKNNKVPDKLAPQKIKDMLDGQAMVKSVIETDSKPEIRLNSNRGGILKSIAIAAVFVLAVGGLAVMKFGTDKGTILTKPAAQPPVVADTDGLTGLRGGTYQSLFNYVKDSESDNLIYSSDELSNDYAFAMDSDNGYQDYSYAEISSMFRDQYESGNAVESEYNTYTNIHTTTSTAQTEDNDDGGLVLQVGSNAFVASYTDVYVYKLQGEETSRVDYDFWEDTYLYKMMADNEINSQLNHTFKAYIVNMFVQDNRLTVTFDFHLPEEYNEKRVMEEYSGFCVYDISDIDNITLVYEYEQPGVLRSAKITEDGQFVFLSELLCADTIVKYIGSYKSESSDFPPSIYENGEKVKSAEDTVYIANQATLPELTFLSAFNVKSDYEKIGDLTLTSPLNSYALTDDCLIIMQEYSKYSNKAHTMKIEFANEVKVTASTYSEEFIWSNAQYFSEQNGYYYIYSPYEITVLDMDLQLVNLVNCCSGTEYEKLYVSSMIKYSTDDYLCDKGVLLEGDTAYVYLIVDSQENGFRYICIESIDISDPTYPIETFYYDSEDAPALYDAHILTLDENTCTGVYREALEGEDESRLYMYSLSQDDVCVNKDMTYYYKDENGNDDCIVYDYTDLGILAQTDILTAKDNENGYIYDYYYLSAVKNTNAYIDRENQIIYIPVATNVITSHTITEEEYYNSDDWYDIDIYNWRQSDDGSNIYDVMDCAVRKVSCIAVSYDIENHTLDVLGEIYASEDSYDTLDDYNDDYSPNLIGCAFLNGKIYAFSDTGMSCTSTKNTDKVLYSDNY